MTKNGLRVLVLLVFTPLGCGVAAAPFSEAERYAAYVTAGKDETQHELHDQAAELWQQAKPELASLPSKERARWWLAHADLLQFEHRFDEALQAIDKVLKEQELQENAYLIQARIALTRHDLAAANTACQQLVDHAPMDVVATCMLEVQGRAGELATSYPALQRLHTRNQNPESALTKWRKQILAEQAQLLERYDEALRWLGYPNYQQQAVVVQKQLLDVLLAMGRGNEVLELTGKCPAVSKLPVDSLLVRIAHAESLQNKQHCWRQVAQERMQLRKLRADELHTSDLAYYFTYVQPDAEQAVHWAKLNSAVAREPFDRALLKAAQEIQP
ncbi:hypothetical protein SAMN06297229_0067 [Pseudidiomarina planktonica]|uniref:Tetratricopeptide repeat-containing protein n=1 Tax=Pseudidiomarina planktonica TaxID=1323738 RepID=A0A1Y6E5X6_9GAMM|nr:hypothetical protein [Pseudidiomarina planktonica]RUO66423.1 hypothetical protein CWI77_08390 [Pseudidiomarina planktonica]SMQ58147.1 hypothetical protein SAMN06297229_0067 [Pseudidiomarina planktonica]